MTARFDPPLIQDNPTGWGPNTVPPKFKDMPYQPFSKADRLGKVSKVNQLLQKNQPTQQYIATTKLIGSYRKPEIVVHHVYSILRYQIGLEILTKIAVI